MDEAEWGKSEVDGTEKVDIAKETSRTTEEAILYSRTLEYDRGLKRENIS